MLSQEMIRSISLGDKWQFDMMDLFEESDKTNTAQLIDRMLKELSEKKIQSESDMRDVIVTLFLISMYKDDRYFDLAILYQYLILCLFSITKHGKHHFLANSLIHLLVDTLNVMWLDTTLLQLDTKNKLIEVCNYILSVDYDTSNTPDIYLALRKTIELLFFQTDNELAIADISKKYRYHFDERIREEYLDAIQSR